MGKLLTPHFALAALSLGEVNLSMVIIWTNNFIKSIMYEFMIIIILNHLYNKRLNGWQQSIYKDINSSY